MSAAMKSREPRTVGEANRSLSALKRREAKLEAQQHAAYVRMERLREEQREVFSQVFSLQAALAEGAFPVRSSARRRR